MNHRNLIPLQRRQGIARARRLRNWTCVAAVEATLLGAFAVAIYVSAEARTLSLGELQHAVQENAFTLDRVKTARVALAAALHQRETSRQFVEQPDWSLLLNSVAATLNGDAMLSRCEICPRLELRSSTATLQSANSPAAPAPRLTGYSVRLAGLARSQNAVSQIVIGLEDLRIFEKVDLVQTSPQVLSNGAGEGIAFQTVCTIGTDQHEVQP